MGSSAPGESPPNLGRCRRTSGALVSMAAEGFGCCAARPRVMRGFPPVIDRLLTTREVADYLAFPRRRFFAATGPASWWESGWRRTCCGSGTRMWSGSRLDPRPTLGRRREDRRRDRGPPPRRARCSQHASGGRVGSGRFSGWASARWRPIGARLKTTIARLSTDMTPANGQDPMSLSRSASLWRPGSRRRSYTLGPI
jgi:hypothetical protein